MIRVGDFKVSKLQKKYVKEVLKNNKITEGPFVDKLEREFEKYFDVKHAILVTNGTVALQLVSTYLISLEKEGLNVVVPAMTFPATINAFIVGGHSVALCDIKEDLQIDVNKLSEQIKEEIDIIVPVHLMGYPADMEEIMKLKDKYGWYVVEDCAESFGTEINGKKVGTFGDFGTFSFYVSHNIGAGELGLVITNDDEAAKTMRSMKNHGRVGDNLKFLHGHVGSNYKTTEFSAALGLASLEESEKILARRQRTAKYFYKNIKNNKLKPFKPLDSVNLLGFPIKCVDNDTKNIVTKRLFDNGIETRDIFPNLANQEAYDSHFNPNDYPIAEEMEKTVFYIGVHEFISNKDRKKIVEILNRVI